MQEALKYGNMAIDADGFNGAGFVNVANCMAALGDPRQARVFYNDGLHLDPSNLIEAIYNLGLINQQLKKYEKAIGFFERMIHITPNNADAIFQMGRTLELMGDKEGAVEWYLKSLGINQHDPGVLKYLAKNCDTRGEPLQAYQYYTDLSLLSSFLFIICEPDFNWEFLLIRNSASNTILLTWKSSNGCLLTSRRRTCQIKRSSTTSEGWSLNPRTRHGASWLPDVTRSQGTAPRPSNATKTF
jgi:tetratricopeptide (TPR) repeat protein